MLGDMHFLEKQILPYIWKDISKVKYLYQANYGRGHEVDIYVVELTVIVAVDNTVGVKNC